MPEAFRGWPIWALFAFFFFLAAAAQASGLVVMEAFHYRYHPLTQRVAEVLRSGVLGPLRHVEDAPA